MEVQPTVFPGKQGKSQVVKSKYNQRTAQAQKFDAKEQPIVHRRVFGTSRNSNIPEKSMPEKPKWQKPSLKLVLSTPPLKEPISKTTSHRKPLAKKSVRPTPSPPNEPQKTDQPVQTTSLEPEDPLGTNQPVQTTPLLLEEPSDNTPLLPIKPPNTTQLVETVFLVPDTAHLLPEKQPNNTIQSVQTAPLMSEEPESTAKQVQTSVELMKTAPTNKDKKNKSVRFQRRSEMVTHTVEGEQTPRPMKEKQRVSETPYHTAERCSKCRFDRMETASYWLSQIKLAEGVGKHNVSAGLFKLALESKAEPIRSLRGELKRYTLRNTYLSNEPEWRDVTVSYGLNISRNDEVKAPENAEHEDST